MGLFISVSGIHSAMRHRLTAFHHFRPESDEKENPHHPVNPV
jgi:hypothetical protein